MGNYSCLVLLVLGVSPLMLCFNVGVNCISQGDPEILSRRFGLDGVSRLLVRVSNAEVVERRVSERQSTYPSQELKEQDCGESAK